MASSKYLCYLPQFVDSIGLSCYNILRSPYIAIELEKHILLFQVYTLAECVAAALSMAYTHASQRVALTAVVFASASKVVFF